MAEGSGSDGGSWAIIIACCSMLINLIVAIVTGVWTWGRTTNATDEKIAVKDKAAAAELTELERRMKIDVDCATKNFGETVTAIRQKVTETELWNRDNFVSKNTFQTVIQNMERFLERFEDKLNERLDRIDKKLDRSANTD